MHEEEIKLLQKRALNFLDSAKERFQKEDWDLVCFMAEQAVQLFLKSLILKEIGEIPKTHSIRKLLGIINQMKEQNIKFERKELLFLENAYLNSRYFNFLYNKEDAELAIKIAEEILNLFKIY